MPRAVSSGAYVSPVTVVCRQAGEACYQLPQLGTAYGPGMAGASLPRCKGAPAPAWEQMKRASFALLAPGKRASPLVVCCEMI